jgi:hypothetical protein
MPNANYKWTMVFDLDDYGWTESYVLNLGAPLSLSKIFQDYCLTIAQARMSLMPPNVTLSFGRVSTIGTRFSVQLYEIGGGGTYPNQPHSLHPNDALLLHWFPVAPGPQKSTFLRGLPIEINVNGLYTPTPLWTKQLASYTRKLSNPVAGAWGWWGVQSSTTSTVNTYVQTINETVLITVNTPIFAGLDPTQLIKVRVSGVNGKSAINGTNVYYPKSATTIETKDKIAVAPYQFGGKVELPVYGFSQILQGNDERLMTRKCGAPLFTERGRARVRARA